MTNLFKFNERNIRKKCEIGSKLTIKTLERRQWLEIGSELGSQGAITGSQIKFFVTVSIGDLIWNDPTAKKQ